MMRDTQ